MLVEQVAQSGQPAPNGLQKEVSYGTNQISVSGQRHQCVSYRSISAENQQGVDNGHASQAANLRSAGQLHNPKGEVDHA